MQAGYRMQEDVSLDFKRHILEKSAGFASEPMADLYRVHLLGMMLNRYDELLGRGLSAENSRRRVMDEFADIAARMCEEGFETLEEGEPVSRFPRLSEAEAERYIRERDGYMHKTALGIFMCVACLTPLMFLGGISELMVGYATDAANMLGLIGMFGMIGTGVYAMVTAVKPKEEKRIRKGRFALGRKLRAKLEALREAAVSKARRRTGKGVAMIVTSIIPTLVGAMLSEMWFSDAWPLLGVGGMFLMIAAGVYELVMADGEKKTVRRLLDSKE